MVAPVLKPIALDGIGKVTDFKVSGFGSATAKGRLDVSGTGSCRFHAQIADLSKSSQETPPFGKVFSDAVTLPLVMDNIPPLPNGKYRAYLISYNDKNCPIQGPNKAAGGWYVDFNVTGSPAPASAPTQTGGTPGGSPPPAGGGAPAPKAATGKIKGEPSASCCDVEFDYQNEFGGWEPLPNSPFSDAGYSLAVTQQAAVVNKSVSYFTQGTHWRMKVRAYKFKTEFEWSDWVEFTTNQN